jgi:branched-chain amino acid transport system permease protein
MVKRGFLATRGIARRVWRNYKAFLLFSPFVLLLPLWAEPLGRSISLNIVYLMRMVGIFTLTAVGLNLLMGYAGQASLGHGAFMGIGAYVSAILSTRWGWPAWAGILLGTLLAAFVGYLLAPILRLRGHYLAMATLGVGIAAFIFFREMTGLTGGNVGIREIPKLNLFGLEISSKKAEFYFVWLLVILVLLLCQNLVRSRVGRAIRAFHQSEVAARIMGVDVASYKMKVFMLSAALGGLAGGIYSHLQGYINPSQFSVMLSIQLVVMVVVGGMESIWGSVAGASLVVFLPSLVEALPKWMGNVPAWVRQYSNYEGLVFGAILVLTMIFLPKGITTSTVEFYRRKTRKAAELMGEEEPVSIPEEEVRNGK